MANLAQSRRRLTWLMMILVVLDVLAIGVLVSPLVSSQTRRNEEFQAIRTQVVAKEKQVVPPEQVQTRIAEARQQIEAFYKDRLASENSSISEQLGKLAAENRINLTQAKYKAESTAIPGLRRLKIDATLVGDYVQEVKFINALERSHVLFLVDSITLGEQQGGNVRLELKLETYMKGQA